MPRSGPATRDALLAAALAVAALALAVAWPGVRELDALGALLLLAAHTPLAVLRDRPTPALIALVVLVLPYHLLQYQHHALVPAEVIALFAYAVLGRRVRLVLGVVAFLLGVCVIGMAMRAGGASVREQIAVVEAVVSVVIAVQVWRSHRARVATITERAERAERTREEEARRRVAEERLRIARDLHDLLAHSITVIGVQAGAAAHLAAGDRPLDRAELAEALKAIAATCREARTELRGTLQVLRGTDVGGPAVLPGPDAIGGLAEAARSAGLEVTLSADGAGSAPPEVGVAAYRIVQEALTNVVKHAAASRVTVTLAREDGSLVVRVADDGRGPSGAGPEGFGILGMIERARSVGGTLDAGPGEDGGFVVTAVLPCAADRSGAEPVTPG
ncbi:sensor histidine kinase [Actinomadura opuntiae]|uniref:sensor histidine kinase n=1 Tax=Actinomadura sp. OS1-43 TaxID=604315 RepID=UPI00255AF1AC|nr:sensor histidine kinase [Actinomadura sp. OS1-43]MDL4812920.1 sensor histidine kinase [Actinomadura sp. OS1-43]